MSKKIYLKRIPKRRANGFCHGYNNEKCYFLGKFAKKPCTRPNDDKYKCYPRGIVYIEKSVLEEIRELWEKIKNGPDLYIWLERVEEIVNGYENAIKGVGDAKNV